MTLLASVEGVGPLGWLLCLPGMTQVIPQARYLPPPQPLYPAGHVLSLGRSQVFWPRLCCFTKSLCTEGLVSPGRRSLELGRQPEAHSPELCRSLREARGLR